MKYWNVPAVTLAFIGEMEIVYVDAFGVNEIGDTASVDNNTLFQAASISKPVKAVDSNRWAQIDLDI